MSTFRMLALTAVGLALAASSIGRADEAANPVTTLDVPRMTDDQIAIAAENLRKDGPAGLERAQQAYFRWMIDCTAGPDDLNPHVDQNARWRRLIDLTAQQKDADVSRLFWYTDWDLAQAEAQRTGKPVLRLFMMGRLTDNLSCANSRFFRVALYSNDQISSLLRDNYVLCWTSVRPVPVITVDYGDGRKLERTVTGNSIHYLVDAEGQLIDVMPGLVGPQTFETWLREGLGKHTNLAQLDEPAKSEQLRINHQDQLAYTLTAWRQALDQIAPAWTPTPPTAAPSNYLPAPETTTIVPAPGPRTPTMGPPTAFDLASLAQTKGEVELPLVQQVAAPVADTRSAPTAIEAAPRAASKAFLELPLVEEVVNATDAPKSLPTENPAPTLPPLPPGASGYGPPPSAFSPPTVPAPTAVEAAPISASKRAIEFPLVNSVVANSTPAPEPAPFDPSPYGTPVAAPPALAAVPIAIGKGRIELPLVAELTPPAAESTIESIEPIAPQADAPAPQQLAEAIQALQISPSKTGVERPLVQNVIGREEIPRLIAETTEEDWNRIAETFADGSRLDETSKSLMNRLHSDPEAPTEATCPTSTIESFERSIALDTARNMYLHRRAILEWILDDGSPTDLVAFNERVYGELFLTPSSDPWIGLVPQDVFTGIEGEGLFGN